MVFIPGRGNIEYKPPSMKNLFDITNDIIRQKIIYTLDNLSDPIIFFRDFIALYGNDWEVQFAKFEFVDDDGKVIYK